MLRPWETLVYVRMASSRCLGVGTDSIGGPGRTRLDPEHMRMQAHVLGALRRYQRPDEPTFWERVFGL